MLTKAQVLEAVSEMPSSEIDLEVLMNKLALLQKIQSAEDDIAAGRTYSTAELRQNLQERGILRKF